MQLVKNIFWVALVASGIAGCTKVDYTTIDEPAYLRVFNNFNFGFSMADKDKKVPFLCMIIDPVFDGKGVPTGGMVVGDFLDVRDYYAPPYPSHIGSSTSVNNPEYPGKENVLVGPIVNGYDLSSWAQVPSGAHRFVFYYRPKNTVPYFKLEPSLLGDAMLDTTLSLTSHEVYTMHLLQKNYKTKENGVLLRQENFHKQSLSDSLTYVNFYNYSADGFTESDDETKPEVFKMGHFQYGIKDRMDIFLTIFPDQELALANNAYRNKPVPGYKGRYMATLERNNNTDVVAPYYNFPVFANPADDGITTMAWQCFEFYTPGMNPSYNPYISELNTGGNFAEMNFISNGINKPTQTNGGVLPNMLVNIHSGKYNPRTFATVNTVEVVNGGVYLTTVQRKYPAPIY